MSKFILVKNDKGNEYVLNTDHIVGIFGVEGDWSKGAVLTLSVGAKGGSNTVKMKAVDGKALRKKLLAE